ncbi:NeuD/PglB/VioB family sugar acetyltransferase [Vibrio sp. NH-UV-68]|uniref:acetyltransferase n=1 Tax=unclassified Vibrio TaxID=2614977 RepID=UPI0036F1DE52
MSKCAILGASGHGKVIAEIAELNGYNDICFFDDRWPKLSHVEHWQVIGTTGQLLESCSYFDAVIVAIGHNQTRIEKQTLLSQKGAHFPTFIHPTATVSQYSQVGEGTVVMAGAVINPFSTIGPNCIINTSATIDHDCVLEEGVHISPGANIAGGVQVGVGSWVGIGASVKQLIKIGNHAVIAAGAVVVQDVLDEQVVAGVPAQQLNN